MVWSYSIVHENGSIDFLLIFERVMEFIHVDDILQLKLNDSNKKEILEILRWGFNLGVHSLGLKFDLTVELKRLFKYSSFDFFIH